MAKIGVVDREVAHILRRHREVSLQVSQAEISRRAKYDNVQMISYIETARNPIPRDMRNRERLARAYQLDITEFCRWCLIAEMERDGMPANLLIHIASEPIFGPEHQGPHPAHLGGPRDPGRPGPERPASRRPAITFADPESATATGTVYRMPNPGLIKDILNAIASTIIPETAPIVAADDQPTRSRSALACQAVRLGLIILRAMIKQKFTESLCRAITGSSACPA